MNKFLISSLRQNFKISNKLYSVKFCNFARSIQKTSINKLVNKVSDNMQNNPNNTFDMNDFNLIPDDIKQQISKNDNLENLNIQNLDQLFGKKDENFAQKEKHKATSKKSEPKEDEDADITKSKEQYEYIYGRAPCEAVLRSTHREIQEVAVLVDYRVGPPEKIKNLIDIANKRKLRIKYMKKDRLDKFTKESKHNGIMIKCSRRDYISLKKFNELKSIIIKPYGNIIVIIDRISDNFNFSNVIRTSVFLGADAIIVNREDRPQLSNIIAKSSHGASEVTKIHSIKFIKHFLSEAREEGWTVLGTKAEKEKEETSNNSEKDSYNKTANECLNVSLNELKIKPESNVIVLISSEIESHLNSCDFKLNISPNLDDRLANKNLLSIVDSLNPGVTIGFILDHLNSLIKIKSQNKNDTTEVSKNTKSSKNK